MKRIFAALLIAGLALQEALLADEITSETDTSKPAAFDIIKAGATTDGRLMTFIMEVAGQAGSSKPVAIGQLAGAKVESYVWPTSLDPAVVGFDPGSGILSLAITAHPDFDDTPLYDEDRDGDPANDGAEWHLALGGPGGGHRLWRRTQGARRVAGRGSASGHCAATCRSRSTVPV